MPTTATPTPSPDSTVVETVETVAAATEDLLGLLVYAGVGVLIGLVLAILLIAILRALGRRRSMYHEAARFGRTPVYALGALAGGYVATVVARLSLALPAWTDVAVQVLLIGVILAGTGVLVALLKAVESSVVKGVRASEDQGRANRVTTQAQVLRRFAEVVVIICGLVGAVMTFPSARLAMGSLLASAGLVSVVAGLAAQSTLGNVFAGIQLAVTDAIR